MLRYIPEALGASHKIARNFSAGELRCRCGRRWRDCPHFIDEDALGSLQRLRDQIGQPLIVNSAQRCAFHNAAVGGVPLSRHVLGQAFDLSWIHWPIPVRHRLVELARPCGFHAIGLYEGFVHIDIRREPAAWGDPKLIGL